MANASTINAGGAAVRASLDDSRLLAGLKRAEARLKAFGSSVQQVGQSLARAGVGAGIPFAAASKTFGDFESAMARVKALTNANEADFGKLGDKAKQLGRDTVFSAAQAAEAMGNFALAGFKVEDILKAAGPTLDLAAAGQIEIAQASDIAAKIMAGMGISADNLGNSVDVLTKAMTTANTDLLMLGDAFKFVGPIAKTAGVSFEEVTAAIQLLSNAGIQGEMAGTTLRGMILSLTAPSADAANTLAELGVQVNDARGNFRGLAPIIGDLEKALSGMGSGARLEKLGTIFPARQAAGAAELVDQGAAKLTEATKALGDAGGTASRIAATQLDTLRGSVDILLSSLEGLGIEIGQAITPTIRAWGESMVGVLNTLSLLAKNNAAFIATVAKGVAAVTAAGAAMVALGLAAKAVAVGLAVVGTTVRAVTVSIYAVNAAFRALKVSITLASVATTAFGAVSAIFAAILSPVGVLTIAVAGLVAWLVKTGAAAEIVASLGGIFKSMGDTAVLAFAGIKDALTAGDIEAASKILWATLKVEWLKGTLYLKSVWADWGVATINAFEAVGTEIGFALSDPLATIRTAWAKAMVDLTTSWGTLVERLIKTFLPFSDLVSKTLGIDVQKSIDDALAAVGVGAGGLAAAQQRDQTVAGIDAERQQQRQAFTDQQEASAEARRQAAEQGLAGMRAELAAAEAGLKEAVDEANKKAMPTVEAVAIEAGGKAGAKGKPGEQQPLTPENVDNALNKAERNVAVRGSFSASAVRGLGVGTNVAERQLSEQKKTNEKLDKTNDRLKDLGGQFV